MDDYWMIEFDYFPEIDISLNICECGASYCIPGKRKGPTVLRFLTSMYQTICLVCNKHTLVADNAKRAGLYWNQNILNNNPGLPLREWRQTNNYTLKDVSRITGLSNQMVSDLELGKKYGSERSRQLIFQGTGIVL